MQQIAEWGLWFLMGACGYAAIHLTISEYRESKRLAKAAERHPSYDYGRLDHLDGLVYREREK